MINSPKKLLMLVLSASMAACSATQQPATTAVVANSTPQPVITQAAHQGENSQQITLEKIMSDPDWLGRQPEGAYWADDSEGLFYWRKREGSPLKDLYQLGLKEQGNGGVVSLSSMHQASYKNRVLNRQQNQAAWIFEGNIFVKQLKSGELFQLTRDDSNRSNLAFLNDGRLSYQQGNAFFVIEPETGLTRQLVSWKFADAPEGVEAPDDYIAEQQIKLIQYVAKTRADRQARFDYQQQLQSQNASMTVQPFYFDSSMETAEASLSPDGKYVILAIEEQGSSRTDDDIMPNYIGEDGRIKAEKVRARVADTEPQSQQLWLLDVTAHKQHSLSYTTLPGYNEDVLADVKMENAKAKGESYTPNRLPRDINLMSDWYWQQSPIQWHQNGKQVAIMLEAWDNKDRWIATVDFSKPSLVSQHRLHDNAWINYKFNSFGWLNQSETLYYLSEESGYAHLYTKVPGKPAKALTKGQYEVDDLTLTRDDGYFYFQANRKHPGIYEIYRVSSQGGLIESVTDLGGMNQYSLSPDESKLLITHSELVMPPELYIQNAQPGAEAKRVTHTVSEEFLALPWTTPEVVAVPSSHTELPIYSRVYRPADQSSEKRRAVIFNHGAGYLQNSHLGWSGYFREFMFHSMLAQQGYVVMDMDYRASMGYGRDWRTAIYRQMGTPETEDLADGVKWLVNNANVDSKRIGTYGGSYGGFMTFMALFTAPELFQAGAALRPVTDWAHYNHGYTSNILNTPDIDPIAYERSSPLYFAEGLQERLLINAPMVDNNVFFVDVVRLVQRLIELEKQDFETAIFPVEPHGFRQPSSWLDEYRRIYKLFEEEL